MSLIFALYLNCCFPSPDKSLYGDGHTETKEKSEIEKSNRILTITWTKSFDTNLYWVNCWTTVHDVFVSLILFVSTVLLNEYLNLALSSQQSVTTHNASRINHACRVAKAFFTRSVVGSKKKKCYRINDYDYICCSSGGVSRVRGWKWIWLSRNE